MRRRTGPPGRCPRNGCVTPRWTSRSWSSCATPWRPSWRSRARPSGHGRSSPRVLAARPAIPGPTRGGAHPASTAHTRRGMAVVRELWLERDKIARRRDRVSGQGAAGLGDRGGRARAARQRSAISLSSGFQNWARGGTPRSGGGRSTGHAPRLRRTCPARPPRTGGPSARAPLGGAGPRGCPAAGGRPHRGRGRSPTSTPAYREPCSRTWCAGCAWRPPEPPSTGRRWGPS